MELQDLDGLTDEELRNVFATGGAARMSARQVKGRLRPLIAAFLALKPGETLSPDDAAPAIGCAPDRITELLKRLVYLVPSAFAKTSEFLPPVVTMMHLVEQTVGTITAKNLSEANLKCREIVERAIRPRFKRFLRETLDSNISRSSGKLEITTDEMVTFLLNEYTGFAKAQSNGLISLAGSYNEGILKRALVNAKFREGTDFDVTGKDSKGDLAFYCTKTTPHEHLFVEIKSYGARERLLRGLQDVGDPKIGVGFFISEKEFNPRRTQKLVNTNALAIYMPRPVFEKLAPDSRARANRFETPFYRALEDFVADMQSFIENGERAFQP